MTDMRYKDVFESLLPPGSLWRPARGQGLDQMLEGQGTNAAVIHDDVSNLAFVRDPYRTPYLDDLEREAGVRPNAALPESKRREQLAAIMFAPDNNGSLDHMQQQLNEAGFGYLTVYENNPITDPNDFLNGQFLIHCGDALAQCGEALAQCGGFAGELVVNGDIYDYTIDWTAVCGEAGMQCGEALAQCGEYSGVTRTLQENTVGSDPQYWPFVFFIGGPIVYGSTEITSIEFVDVPTVDREILRRIILKYKPLHSWCALLVSYV